MGQPLILKLRHPDDLSAIAELVEGRDVVLVVAALDSAALDEGYPRGQVASVEQGPLKIKLIGILQLLLPMLRFLSRYRTTMRTRLPRSAWPFPPFFRLIRALLFIGHYNLVPDRLGLLRQRLHRKALYELHGPIVHVGVH